eukprot:SM000138S00027  [mRNA]  locus=s138:59575:60125:- [translate_table: standard]
MKAVAVERCRAPLAAFADCARGRVLSVVWACRQQARDMNACLKEHTTDEILEDLKCKYWEEQQGKDGRAPLPP